MEFGLPVLLPIGFLLQDRDLIRNICFIADLDCDQLWVELKAFNDRQPANGHVGVAVNSISKIRFFFLA